MGWWWAEIQKGKRVEREEGFCEATETDWVSSIGMSFTACALY